MYRELFFLVSFVLVLGLAGNASAGVTMDWDGEARPDRSWTTDLNWDSNTMPVLGDRVDLYYDPCDPNRYRLYAPLVTDGMDVTIGNVLDALYISMTDTYVIEDLNNPDGGPDPNACVVDINGGKLTLEGYLGIAHKGYGIINISGGTFTIHGGGKFRFGKYGPRFSGGVQRPRSFATVNMTGGVIDYSDGTIDLPSNLGSGHLQLDGGTVYCNNLDMDEQVEPNQYGTMDLNGGTFISNENRKGKFGRYANTGWIKAYGLEHGSIDPCTGLRAVVAIDYDITNAGKTTMVAALVDPNKPYSPNPSDEGTGGLDPNNKILLSWGEIVGTALHDVYFGTSETDVNDANTSSPEYKATVTDTSWYTGVLGLGVTRYWRIDEYVPKGAYSTQLADGFEGSPWNANWNDVASIWIDETGDVNTGSHAAGINNGIDNSGNPLPFTSDDMDTSDATRIKLRFAFKWRSTSIFTVEFYGTDGWSTPVDLEAEGASATWTEYATTLVETKYFHSAFKMRFTASFTGGGSRYAIVDDVEVLKQTAEDFFKGDVWEFISVGAVCQD